MQRNRAYRTIRLRPVPSDHFVSATMGEEVFREITRPLPVQMREPLVLLIDAWAARRIWTTRLLSLAHYRVYPVETPLEAYIWCVQHTMQPQALLIGYVAPRSQYLIQRLLHWHEGQWQIMPSLLSLAQRLPHTLFQSATPSGELAIGSVALLQLLWVTIARDRE